MISQRRQPDPHHARNRKCLFVTRLVAGISATLLALPGAAQDNSVDTENLANQQPVFGVSPAAQTARIIGPPPEGWQPDLFGFYAALGVGARRHSNVRRTANSEISDTAFVIQPELAYENDIRGRHRGRIGYAANILRHRDLDNEDVTNQSLTGALRFDLTPALEIGLFGQFNDSSEERGGSGSRTFEDLEPDKVETLTYGGNLIFGRPSQTFRVVVGASKSEWEYQNNDQEFRDRDYASVRGALFYNVAPKTSLFLEARHTDIEYPQQIENRDSKEEAYFVGVRWRATNLIDVLAKVGQLDKDMDDPNLPDYDGSTYLGKILWAPRPYSRFDLYASRTTEEAAQQEFDPSGSAYFVSDLIGVNWIHDLTSRWRFFAFYNHIEDDYTDDRLDKINDYGVGVSYKINDWLNVAAQYGEVKRDSNVPEVEYKDEVASIFLRGDFRMGSRAR